MTLPRVLVLTGYGLNCDHETAYAFELAGARVYRAHINALIDRDIRLQDHQIMVFGGGFSWGDDHGAGVIQAVRMKTRLGDQILEFVEKKKLVLGICNGFQTLVNLGLLPGFDGEKAARTVALTFNDCGNFRDDWVWLAVNPSSPCVFTRDLEFLELPIRHGEGKFYAEDAVIDRLIDHHHVVLRYAFPDRTPASGRFPYNPNGSVQDIAGICDATGRIFGLMPHPEAFNHWTNHPDWTRHKSDMTRRGESCQSGSTPGVRLLQNGVAFFSDS